MRCRPSQRCAPMVVYGGDIYIYIYIGGGTVTALPKDNLGNAGSLGESFPSTKDRIPIGTVSSLVGNVISFPSSNGLHGGTDVHWGGNLDSIYGVVPNRNGTTSNRLAGTTESTTGTSNYSSSSTVSRFHEYGV